MNLKLFSVILTLIVACSACSVSRHIPDDKSLLDKVSIHSDGKGVSSSEMEEYLRQKPNSSWPLFGKVKLHLYHVGWFRKIFPKLTEKPVFYSPKLTKESAEQIKQENSNRGFLRAGIDTIITTKGKKTKVVYIIHPDEVYKIRNYSNEISDTTIQRITTRVSQNSSIKKGKAFDLEKLDEEKNRMAQVLRNTGYYNFNKEFLYYKADTTVGEKQVDLKLSLYPAPDSLPHKRYHIGDVIIYSGLEKADSKHLDTVLYKGIKIICGKNRFLRPSVIYKNNFLSPKRWYSERRVNSTISSFSGVQAINQTNVSFSDTIINDSTSLTARIVLSEANAHTFQVGLEGTNTAGDLGVAGNLGYKYKNLFNGAEVLDLKFRGAYEFVSKSESKDLISQSFYEFGVETLLSFPQIVFPWLGSKVKDRPNASTQFKIGLTNQHRPEYTREFFNFGLNYSWSSFSNQLSHKIDFLDVTFVRMPWVSDLFEKEYINNPRYPLLRYSYENQLISRLAYSNVFTSTKRRRNNNNNNYTLRTGVELAGSLPRLIGLMHGTKTNADGNEEILGIRYAEYVRFDFDFAQANKINESTTIAYHAAFGVAKPYRNSSILPFEKRYFSGGANSVRGWGTRQLGPGFYHPNRDSVEFANQVGDIKLDLSIELRKKLNRYFQLALFCDAGNNWIINNNESTLPGSFFQFSEFYKQIALSYGMGFRLDLQFLLLRFDGGFKAFDPGQEASKRWRFKGFNFGDDFAFHFGIGYPF